ncbi:TIGR01459 family HAD-type hydrolase [Rhizobiales bacterium]|uniref:TIGR01459 family HAD-type hydrolase n=1 Tax=Hongsoonwoonella zoysiae TaxID=2821844 RepID=UPI0015604E0C|nr:TIGR01459 family HAD-type hydrolase [Hongsoonwoonella zoysiae]NRG19832.1 TIGR01459 family HAD-type hydrolase [Hongsoonwoonella zoysiae]
MNAQSPLLIPGLSAIAGEYKGLLCDVWGVLHNGVTGFMQARDALASFREKRGGTVVLITNAPRPSAPIFDQLATLGITHDAYDAIVTSGDVTRQRLRALGDANVLHLGPERDLSLYEETDVRLGEEAAAAAVVCTGLFDDTSETPDDYRDMLTRLAKRGLPMICANPDIVVERGNKLIWCAGALARLYEDLGGEVKILGKPHAPIYDAALDALSDKAGARIDKRQVLAIGDGLPTDIRGAVSQDIDVLFISGGIHAADFGPTEDPDEALIRRRLAEEGLTARAAVPKLVW